MPVKIIKAKKHNQSAGSSGSSGENNKRLRVAAYCRVSTDSEEQENSYEAQKAHYESLINSHDDWTMVGIFADQGISGTSADKRPEFQRLIAACENGEVDKVLTKSISRFSRNTVDTLRYIRLLKGLNIPIFFEKENIDTMDAAGEILITVLSAISQQESASISENVRLGHMYNFQQGKGYINEKYFYGFSKGPEPHTMVINPEQAIIVRRIYRLFLEGYSPAMIAKMLNEDGIPTATGSGKWFDTTITNILSNEKHCGDLLLQKYYTSDFLSHKLVRNKGERQQYFVEDDHDPIIPKEIFYQVQGELRRRSFMKSDPNSVRYGSRNALNGRTICGECGSRMKRYRKKDEDESDWRCERHVLIHVGEEGRCEIGAAAKEKELKRAVVQAFNEVQRVELIRLEAQGKGEVDSIDALLAHIEEEEESGPSEERMIELEKKRNELFSSRAVAENAVVQIRLFLEFLDRKKRIVDEGEACKTVDEFYELTRYRVPKGVMDENGIMVRYDNGVVVRYLENLTVYKDRIIVRFKAGVEVEIQRRKK